MDNDKAIRYEKLINDIRSEQSKQKSKMTLITKMILSILNITIK